MPANNLNQAINTVSLRQICDLGIALIFVEQIK